MAAMASPVFARMQRRIVESLWSCLVCLLLCVVTTSAAHALSANDNCAVTNAGRSGSANSPTTLVFGGSNSNAPNISSNPFSSPAQTAQYIDTGGASCDFVSVGIYANSSDTPLTPVTITVSSATNHIPVTFTPQSCDSGLSGNNDCDSSSPGGNQYYNVQIGTIPNGATSPDTITVYTCANTCGTTTGILDTQVNITIQFSSLATTTTTVSSSLNPSDSGQQVTFSAVLTGGSSPTGTITFLDTGSSLGSDTVTGDGTYSLITTTLGVGSHNITAQYSGDSNNATSSGTLFGNPQVVNALPTATQAIPTKILTQNNVATSFTPVTGGGGTTPLSYGVAPPLPSGLSMSSGSGAITGTPSGTTTATSYTVTVTDANSATAANNFTLAVNPAVTATQAIATKTLTQNHVATFTPVTGGGGTIPLSYGVLPPLPSGLSMSSASGAITGTPTGTTAATIHTVTVTDANGATAANNFSLAVNPAVTATQAIATTTLTQNHLVASLMPVTGGGGTTPLSYAIAPTLPTGLSMSSVTGAIAGTPAVTSSATSYTVTVTDTNGATATASFSLTVNPVVTATQAIATTTLTQNHLTTSFTPVTGSGGTAPLSYGVSPPLPTGLSMSSVTGAITGTPAVTTTATSYTVTVTDANGATATNSFSLTVNPVVTATQAIASTTLIQNQTANFTPVTGGGGTTPLSYGVSPTLPAGLSISSVTGAITGTPTVTSSATNYAVTVTDANGATATANFSLTVNPPAPIVTSISPSLGSSAGGGAVTITGTNLTGATAVQFGSNAATSFAVNSATQIAATAPAGAGTVDITVTTPGGTSATSAADHFSYTSLPTVTSVSPNSGPPAGGASVTIAGINFTGATAVKFGAANAATFNVINASTMTATSPPGSAGVVDVIVTTTQGTSVTGAADKFTYAVPKAMQNGAKLGGSGNIGPANEGYSVALSTDGNTLAVGGYGDNSLIGAVWIFTRSGGAWTQQGTKLVGTNGATPEQGYAVALSADGNTLLFGGPLDNGAGGSAWVFTRSGTTWTQQGLKLTASDETGNGIFGTSVALSSDGTTAIIGGPNDNGNIGAAWIFTRSGSTWTQQGLKLTPSDESGNGTFGNAVALSSNGNTAMIGGASDSGGTGASWVFTRSGSAWTQQGLKLTASDESGNGALGTSVSLSSDGNTALVGGESDNGSMGASWVFTRSGSAWTQQGSKLVGTGVVGYALQGASVALSSTGTTAVVGGPADNAGGGAVWLFTQSNGTWNQKGAKLVGTGNVGLAQQGTSVALSGDGKTIAEGGQFDNGNVGAAWVFAADTLVASHDFNGDSISDILWRDTEGDTTIWLMHGATVQQASSVGTIASAWSVAGVRDFNGDGDADILWRDTSGDTTIWLMNGVSVTQGISLGNIPAAWSVVGTGDFNGDGIGDILWRDTSGDTAIWLGPFTGGHVASASSLGTVPTIWSVAGTGDFNGDGTTDILWRDVGGDIAIWEMIGGSIKQGVGLGNLPAIWSVAGTGDFNGDGTSDIVWRDTSGDVMIWLISNGALAQQSVLGNLPTTWSLAETGDFNGDNNSDILWIDSSGNVMIWFMNGISVITTVSLGNVGTAWAVQGSNGD